MKRYLIILLSVVILLVHCKKIDLDTDSPITIQVLEKFSNNPVEGAKVDIVKCSEYDFLFGWTQCTTIATLTTNNAGQVTFSLAFGFYVLRAQHQNYYPAEVEGFQSIILTPKCTIKASIKRVNTYSPGDVLSIKIQDPDCASYSCWSRVYTIGLPNDVILFFEGQGYTDNEVSWSINSTSHALPSFYVNRFDTAQVNIEY